jgi:uncharacterized protein YqfA (UPF0365 family)
MPLLLAALDPWMLLFIGAAVVGGLFLMAMVVVFFIYGSHWFQAYMSGADVSIWSLVGMGFRRVDPRTIVQAKVMAAQSGLNIGRGGITTSRLEAHYLSEGNVMNVIKALIAAQRAQLDLDFDKAAAIDLAGRDVMDAVRTSVHPKVIDCPDPVRGGHSELSAIAKDGIELRVKARVTVKTNLEQLIGGATEETVIARVGESIISSIGSSESHRDVLANPDRISKAVLHRRLDSETAFEIVSIDIAHVYPGKNIGARLKFDRAEADKRMERAQAEKERAEAVALEQENRARVAEHRAKLILAETAVPHALAQAFRAGIIENRGGNGSV